MLGEHVDDDLMEMKACPWGRESMRAAQVTRDNLILTTLMLSLHHFFLVTCCGRVNIKL
jgi:hypothetical protein